MKSWLQGNEMEMHSTHSSLILIRTLKKKIYKYLTSVSKNMYIDKLAEIANRYNNIYHSTIKMKPADVGSSRHIDFSEENYEKASKFKAGEHVRTSKFKNIFVKGSRSKLEYRSFYN